MDWAHLPVAGGLYDQHPRFLDDILIIFNEDAKAEHERAEKQRREMERKQLRANSRRR